MKISQFILASRPTGLPSPETFRLEHTELPALKDNEVLLKAWYLSVDPYMRGRMNDVKSYAASFEVGKPIAGSVVAKVTESMNKKFRKGDVVTGHLPWATYSIANGEHIQKIDNMDVPPSYFLGILGMPGRTAYFGITDIGRPEKGDTVVISGAAGAVGIVAGQIAKIMGARVVGIAGTDEKCRMLKEEFGYDDALNYKTSKSLRKDLAALAPEGVDVYFDNVGGEITDAVVANLDFHARIALCGQISHYNDTRIPVSMSILPMLLTRSVKLQGFIVGNYSAKFEDASRQLAEWVTTGKLKYTETIVHGFEKLPETFLGLFEGKNSGKMLVEAE